MVHDELIIIESGMFDEGDQLEEKEELQEEEQIPPMTDTEVAVSDFMSFEHNNIPFCRQFTSTSRESELNCL